MKKFVFITLSILLLACFAYASTRLFFFATDGFTEDNITSEFAYRELWVHPKITPEEETDALRILNQKFYYLGRGAQSYAFQSEDEQYILKLIKQKHLKLKSWEDLLLRLPFTEKLREAKLAKRRGKVENILQSCQISFEELRKETALLYLHLNKTDHLNQIVKIYDKMGFEHLINLDEMEFCIQRFAELALPYISSKLQKGAQEEARRAIEKMISLRIEISKQGILDQDTGFLNNMGFIEDSPVIIDIGQFKKDETIKDKEKYSKDLTRKTEVLRKWLQNQYPALSEHVEEQLTRISNKILDEGGQDVTTDLPTMGREHCPKDKARPIGGKDGVTGCSDSPRVVRNTGYTKLQSDEIL